MKGHCTDPAGCAEKSRRLAAWLEKHLEVGMHDHEELLKRMAAGQEMSISMHLRRRMVLRALSRSDITEVVECGEVISYHELPNGWYSILIMGTIASGRCIHVVLRYTWDDTTWYLEAKTAYDPAITPWMWDTTLHHRICFCVPEAVYEEGEEE